MVVIGANTKFSRRRNASKGNVNGTAGNNRGPATTFIPVSYPKTRIEPETKVPKVKRKFCWVVDADGFRTRVLVEERAEKVSGEAEAKVATSTTPATSRAIPRAITAATTGTWAGIASRAGISSAAPCKRSVSWADMVEDDMEEAASTAESRVTPTLTTTSASSAPALPLPVEMEWDVYPSNV